MWGVGSNNINKMSFVLYAFPCPSECLLCDFEISDLQNLKFQNLKFQILDSKNPLLAR